jgi:hypothetical protein
VRVWDWYLQASDSPTVPAAQNSQNTLAKEGRSFEGRPLVRLLIQTEEVLLATPSAGLTDVQPASPAPGAGPMGSQKYFSLSDGFPVPWLLREEGFPVGKGAV